MLQGSKQCAPQAPPPNTLPPFLTEKEGGAESSPPKPPQPLPIVHNQTLLLAAITPPCQVRHGIMVVGPTGTGKSSMIDSLAAAYTRLGSKTVVWRMNPKAMQTEQMFGQIDATTGGYGGGRLGRQERCGNQSCRPPDPRRLHQAVVHACLIFARLPCRGVGGRCVCRAVEAGGQSQAPEHVDRDGWPGGRHLDRKPQLGGWPCSARLGRACLCGERFPAAFPPAPFKPNCRCWTTTECSRCPTVTEFP